MKMGHDLLVEPLLSWRDAQRRRSMTTLPGILSRLASGELGDFPRLRTHQLHPWCMFLTQLAAITLHRAGKTDPGLSVDEWRELLLKLTDGAHEPWTLVVEDLRQPAFFQSPVPENSLDDWKGVAETPDDIDVLVTAKGHDVKTALMRSYEPETWVYALTTLQTMQGFPGRGYNRVARMNGGYGNRPRVGLSADQTFGSRFLRDVGTLLASWPGLVKRGFHDGGVALVWTQAWDGATSLAMQDLAPHFIEVCWRVRCQVAETGVRCRYATTEARRCVPEVENGDVGDPWTPIERDKGALSVGSGGFHYQLLTRLLFESDFEPAAAQKPHDTDPDPTLFMAAALARGQGKTEGLHERVLALPRPVRRQLGRPDTRAALGRRAAERVVAAKTMRGNVLYPALKRLALGSTVIPDYFDARVDGFFFDHLFTTLDMGDDEARLAFHANLRQVAWDELQRAAASCCVPDARRLKVISDAERMFKGCLKKQFPDLLAVEATTQGERA